ncbi:MAG: helix-turn-helix transcriptional regulator [Actinomycetota bacterium]|nr:helix-turn-helix transcriptional regulator [Actinomycetota bacterium]
MDDLGKYINNRKNTEKKFSDKFDEEYEKFKIGILLRKARKEAKMTQDELASLIKTKKASISRLENHSQDIKLSTLIKIAAALNKQLKISLD